MNRRLRVTLVGGFPGAGKTSLLHHFISEHQGGCLAVLVETSGALNLDAKAIRGLCGAMRRSQDMVLEIPGLEEAAQIDWLAETLRELAASGRFEQVLIEIAGTTNASRLGRHFGSLTGEPGKLSAWADLRQIVGVVDALDFYRGTVLPARRGPAMSTDALVELQQAQIEGASLLVLNKCDLVDEAERSACAEHLRRINPEAALIETAYGELPPESLGRPATSPPRWEDPITAARKETGGADLASVLYRAYRPFHPERFWDWFNADHPGLLRVKGLVWLATRNLLVGGVSRTRWQNGCGGAGIWWAALPREEWPQEPAALARMRETWREPYGDRRQELVLLGEAAALSPLARQLNGCLLNDAEFARPPQEWLTLRDPFPTWDVGEET
jgi:G3E family GTPase